MARFEILESVPRLHMTPLATIRVEEGRVVVEADDEHEKRIRFVCQPYQAVRVVTADCFDVPEGSAIRPGEVIEIHDSEWLAELANALKRHDHGATFMEKARHFLFPLQDDFLEVVAWDLRYEPPHG
jgi:hypothetical protein